jgi:hypothetical protein
MLSKAQTQSPRFFYLNLARAFKSWVTPGHLKHELRVVVEEKARKSALLLKRSKLNKFPSLRSLLVLLCFSGEI